MYHHWHRKLFHSAAAVFFFLQILGQSSHSEKWAGHGMLPRRAEPKCIPSAMLPLSRFQTGRAAGLASILCTVSLRSTELLPVNSLGQQLMAWNLAPGKVKAPFRISQETNYFAAWKLTCLTCMLEKIGKLDTTLWLVLRANACWTRWSLLDRFQNKFLSASVIVFA